MSAVFTSRRRAVWVLGLSLMTLGALYGGVLIWFHAKEDALLFRPVRGPLAAPPARLHLDSLDVPLAEDGGGAGPSLVARVIHPPPEIASSKAGWILYLHGASGNVGTLGYNEAWSKFRRLGLGVVAVDYRGYGESTGTPSEAGLYEDADAAYSYLVNRMHVPPQRVLIYGYSLGSAVAIDLASRVPAAGLMVEGAFLSIPDRGAELYPYLPVAWLAHNRFASVDKIGRVVMPKLFIHARQDTIVPIRHGRKLFELAAPPKVLQEVSGGHVDANQVDPEFFNAIARFVLGLGLPVLMPKP